MAISSSTEVVRDMKITLQQTIKEINVIQDGLRSTMQSANNWNDSQGEEYRELMKKIAKLTEAPKRTLMEAVPKMNRMLEALEDYEKVRF